LNRQPYGKNTAILEEELRPRRHSCCHAAKAADHINEQNIQELVEFAGVSAVVQVYQSAYELAIVAVRNR